MVRNPDHKSKYLIELLDEEMLVKIFHHALFDIRFLKATLGVETNNVECTKVLSKIMYPQIPSGLGHLIKEYYDIEIDKEIDHGGWDKEDLNDKQLEYASNDVLYLIDMFNELYAKCSKSQLYDTVMKALLTKAYVEVEGYTDLFDYPQTDHRQTKREREWWENKFKE